MTQRLDAQEARSLQYFREQVSFELCGFYDMVRATLLRASTTCTISLETNTGVAILAPRCAPTGAEQSGAVPRHGCHRRSPRISR
jgi:hypothetical protein